MSVTDLAKIIKIIAILKRCEEVDFQISEASEIIKKIREVIDL